MAQTGSVIAFIVLAAIVVIGVIVYVYLTVMNQSKERQAAVAKLEEELPSKPQGPANFAEFSSLVSQNRTAELVIPLLDLYTAKIRLANMLNAPGAPGIAPLRLDQNLEAVCTQCGKKVSGSEFAPPTTDICSTPNCGSKLYTLRWLASPLIEEIPQPTNGWVD